MNGCPASVSPSLSFCSIVPLSPSILLLQLKHALLTASGAGIEVEAAWQTHRQQAPLKLSPDSVLTDCFLCQCSARHVARPLPSACMCVCVCVCVVSCSNVLCHIYLESFLILLLAITHNRNRFQKTSSYCTFPMLHFSHPVPAALSSWVWVCVLYNGSNDVFTLSYKCHVLGAFCLPAGCNPLNL